MLMDQPPVAPPPLEAHPLLQNHLARISTSGLEPYASKIVVYGYSSPLRFVTSCNTDRSGDCPRLVANLASSLRSAHVGSAYMYIFLTQGSHLRRLELAVLAAAVYHITSHNSSDVQVQKVPTSGIPLRSRARIAIKVAWADKLE
jgi:hypothetical protein